MGGRRALVVGSQCDALGHLGFLPDLATELYAVLTDPCLGACEPALPGGGLVHDPSREEVLDALEEAFTGADRAGATLLVALLGHGIAVGGDFYYLPRDAAAAGRLRRDVLLSQHLKELLRDSRDLDGLVVLLDTCHAGVAAQAAAVEWSRTVGLGENLRRYTMISGCADEPAYGGDFTRGLIEVLQRGVPPAGSTIDARYLIEPVHRIASRQRPQLLAVDGGGYRRNGDEGLWLAHNAVLRREDDTTVTSAVRGRVVELTGFLQPTPTLDALVAAAREYACTVVTGVRGSGKSTLAAALARPEATRGGVPDGFVHAIAFAARGSTLATLTSQLFGQLQVTVPGFSSAAGAYEAGLEESERQGLDALRRRVLGPLSRLALPAPVRLVIDAMDELPAATQDALRGAIAAAQTVVGGQEVSFVLSAGPAAAVPAGAHRLDVERPGDDIVTAYMRQRGVPGEHVPALVSKAGGSWLHAYLLTERALRPGFDPQEVPPEPALTLLYDGELLAAGAGDRDRWETRLRPVLAAVAVAGAGPVLPLPLLVAASARLGGPSTTSGIRDALVRLSGLVIRSHPGQPQEQLGLFHVSLAEDYLLAPHPVTPFTLDPKSAHRALADALVELAPAGEHDPADPLHRYALRAEADHHWGYGNSSGVVTSLRSRPAERMVDERERWSHWSTVFTSALGAEHPDTLSVRSHLAYWTGMVGHAAGARDGYAQLLPIWERVSGPEHPDTLRARANLARWIGEAGDALGARNAYAELLPIRERVSGPEDPDTLAARANLALLTGLTGDRDRARDAFAELLPIRERVSGSKDPRTLAARSNLARWTGLAGEPAAARDAFEDLLPVVEGVLGPEHPATLIDRGELASWTGRAGDPVGARDAHARLLPVRERVLPPNHPDTLDSRAELAFWTGTAGNPVEAREAFAELLPIRARVCGPEHPDTLTTRAHLARFTGEAGDPVRAREAFAELLPVMERVLGLEHPDTQSVRADLAHWTRRAGNGRTQE